MAEIHGELHTTCRILRAQEISPSRSLSAAVIFSELSSCQRRTVASWGNRGRDGYVLGKPLNLFLDRHKRLATLHVSALSQTANTECEATRHVSIFGPRTLRHVHSHHMPWWPRARFHVDRSSRKSPPRLDGPCRKQSHKPHGFPSLRYQLGRSEPARGFLQNPFERSP